MKLLTHALSFAAQKHSTQRRMDPARSPYLNHVIDVLHTLVHDGGIEDESVLAAGLLHDTVEDTDTTEDELREQFGDRIANVVLEVTDDKSLEKMERKRLQVETAPRKSKDAKAIKLADKISNLRSIIIAPPASWPLSRQREYFVWAKRVIDGLRNDHPVLEKVFDKVYEEGMAVFERMDTSQA